MTLQYIMLFAGAIIVAVGIYMKDKQFKNVTEERVVALVAYCGWALMCIPASKLASPLFAGMSGNWPDTLVLALEVVLFIVGAEIFLKGPFDRSAADKYKVARLDGRGKGSKNGSKNGKSGNKSGNKKNGKKSGRR